MGFEVKSPTPWGFENRFPTPWGPINGDPMGTPSPHGVGPKHYLRAVSVCTKTTLISDSVGGAVGVSHTCYDPGSKYADL